MNQIRDLAADAARYRILRENPQIMYELKGYKLPAEAWSQPEDLDKALDNWTPLELAGSIPGFADPESFAKQRNAQANHVDQLQFRKADVGVAQTQQKQDQRKFQQLQNDLNLSNTLSATIQNSVDRIQEAWKEAVINEAKLKVEIRSLKAALAANAVADNLRFEVRESTKSLVSELAKNEITFEEAWAAYEKKGYRYDADALEQVRFGWRIAMEARAS